MKSIIPPLFGILAVLTYIIFRIILFPLWFYWFLQDFYFGEDPSFLSNFEFYFYPFSIFVLWILSWIWLNSIYKGTKRVVQRYLEDNNFYGEKKEHRA